MVVCLQVSNSVGKLQQAVVQQAAIVLSAHCDRVMVVQARTHRRTVCTVPQPSSSETALARKQLCAYMEHAARPIIVQKVASVELFSDCAHQCRGALRKACSLGAIESIKEHAVAELHLLADQVRGAHPSRGCSRGTWHTLVVGGARVTFISSS